MILIKPTIEWLCMALFNHKSLYGFLQPLVQMVFPAYRVNRFRAHVLGIRDENTEVYTVVLKLSRFWQGFIAGQFIEISVQHNGINYSRIFTISSAPQLFKSQGIIELSIKKQKSGLLTPWMYGGLKKGDYISVSAAKGDFCIQDKTKPMLFIAAGSGITPFRSLLSDCSYEADIHLIYYANQASHLFVNELKHHEKLHKNLSVSFVDSSHSGRIALSHLQTECQDFRQRHIYICGPAAMMAATVQILVDNNVPTKQIYSEYFASKPLGEISLNTSRTVSFELSSLKTVVDKECKNTLLELAEASGLRPITGCRMGICHQCICQKKHGVVYNTLTKTYSDTAAQEVQLCISVPVGDVSLNL